MSDDLNLEFGDPGEVPERRRRRKTTSTDTGKGTAAQAKLDAEITSRLERTFDRIVKARRAHDDEELADVVEEDAEIMTETFVGLTENVPFLRMPLIMVLNIVEPVLAFSRLGRILFHRLIEWRDRRYAAQEQARAEWEAANNGGEGVKPGASVA